MVNLGFSEHSFEDSITLANIYISCLSMDENNHNHKVLTS